MCDARMMLAAITLSLALAGCVRVGSAGDIAEMPTSPAGGFNPGLDVLRPAEPTPALLLLEDPPPRTTYVLNVTLDYAAGVVSAQQRIEFTNPAGAPLQRIRFNVPPARRAGAFTLHDVRLSGAADPLPFTLEDAILTIDLPAPLPVGAALAVSFDFTFKIALQETVTGIGGDDTSRGPQGLICGHWYIMLAPFLNGDWYTPSFVPIGDPYTSELADHEVSILAPEGVIVAGAGEESRSGRLWRYSLPRARVFAFAASDQYQMDSVVRDGVTIIHYAYPQHRAFAEDVLITAERALVLFGRLYGEYPYRTLRIVETGRSQGQEYSGLVSIGAALYQGYRGSGARHDLIATTVHEVSHQWWFNVVGNDQIQSPWLDEALARYMELRFYREYYPADADWWYAYFILGRDPSAVRGAIDLSIYDYPDARTYVNAVYRRGLVFMNELSKRLTPVVLDEALRTYHQRMAYRVAQPEDFFDAIAEHTDQDISDLVRVYFARPLRLPCRISGNAPDCRA